MTAELRARGWNVNHKRVARLMAEDNRTPEQFEQNLAAQPAAVPVAAMSFFRHEGIYRPEGAEQTGKRLQPLPGLPLGSTSVR